MSRIAFFAPSKRLYSSSVLKVIMTGIPLSINRSMLKKVWNSVKESILAFGIIDFIGYVVYMFAMKTKKGCGAIKKIKRNKE